MIRIVARSGLRLSPEQGRTEKGAGRVVRAGSATADGKRVEGCQCGYGTHTVSYAFLLPPPSRLGSGFHSLILESRGNSAGCNGLIVLEYGLAILSGLTDLNLEYVHSPDPHMIVEWLGYQHGAISTSAAQPEFPCTV
jgi:hypothetical protein